MKLMIVDDEIGVANAIRSLYDWNALGIDKTYVFDSAVEALEQLRNEAADILITDILMPGIDGLELTQKVLDFSPDTKVIMCSGYDDFEYAQQAVRLGVMEYLLKPVTIEEIVSAVQRAIHTINQERSKRKIEQEYAKNIDLYSKNAKNIYSALIIRESRDLSETELSEFLRLIKAKETPEWGFCFCIKVIGQNENRLWNLKEDLSILYFAIDNILNEMLESRGCAFDPGVNAAAFFFGTGIEDGVEKVYRCRNALQDMLGIKVAVGIGKVTRPITNLYESYRQAQLACEHCAFYLRDEILKYEEMQLIYSYPVEVESKLLSKITIAAEDGKESVEDIVDSYFDKVIEEANLSAEDIKSICDSILISCIKKLHTLDEEATPLQQWLKKEQDFQNINDVKRNLILKIKEMEDVLKKDKTNKNRILIENVKKYISENLSENLSLETVSKKFYFSSRYFAHLFKEYSGINYIDYINDIRMKEAQRCLVNTSMSIHEIAKRVGYEDQGHFCRNFKKFTGKNPSEYRKKCRGLNINRV